MFKTIGIIGRHRDDRAASAVAELSRHLSGRDREVLWDEDSTTANADQGFQRVSRDELGEASDLIVVLSGDGTLLGAARSLVDYEVPLAGVNLGRLGFLTEISPNEMYERIDEILEGQYVEERRYLLKARIEGPDADPAPLVALNEVVAHKLNIARLIELETYVDHRLMSRQRCDAMVVATPTGSTAYALSGGGPIVQPGVDAMVLVPIAPHTLTSRPVVVNSRSEVEIRVQVMAPGEVQITCDGQVGRPLAEGEVLHVRRHDRELRLLQPQTHDYFATLRTKLYWGRET